jgi:hypothetical protein
LPTIKPAQREAATGTLDSYPQLNPQQSRRETARTGAHQRDERTMGELAEDHRKPMNTAKISGPARAGATRREKAGEGIRTLNNQLGRLEL